MGSCYDKLLLRSCAYTVGNSHILVNAVEFLLSQTHLNQSNQKPGQARSELCQMFDAELWLLGGR